jgi:hypothetical protein
VPALVSLVWIRCSTGLAEQIEAEADYAQRQRERIGQEAELAGRVAARLGADNLETPPGPCYGRCTCRPRAWSGATS